MTATGRSARGPRVTVVASTEPIDLGAWARQYVAALLALEERSAANATVTPLPAPHASLTTAAREAV